MELKVTDRLTCSEWRERLGVADIIAVAKMASLCFKKGREWFGEKCIRYEVEGVRTRGGPKKAWTDFIEKYCKTLQVCKEDAVDRWKWRKLIKDVVQ